MSNIMTKKDYFNAIRNFVEERNEEHTYDSYVWFLDHEIELLNKRNSRPSKPTKNQIENENIKAIIREVLNAAEAPMTIAEIQDADERIAAKVYTNQRMTACLNQMTDVTRTYEGRKPKFAIAEENTDVDEEIENTDVNEESVKED